MTWQLRQIGVYEFNTGELRELTLPKTRNFHLISGRMQRGKSALQDIVHYCLIKGESTIPPGVITDRVDAVGIAIANSESTLVIVRPLPEATSLPATKVWMDLSKDGRLPTLMPTDFRYTTREALAEISRFTGIQADTLKPRSGNPHGSNVSVKHAIPYCFQPQEVIANPRSLLPDLEFYYKAEDILDAADYFFGLLDQDGLRLKHDIAQLESQLRTAERQASDLAATGATGSKAGLELLASAQQLGLAPEGVPQNLFDLVQALRAVLTAKPSMSATQSSATLQAAVEGLRRTRQQITMLTGKARRLAGYELELQEYLQGHQEQVDNLNFIPVEHITGKAKDCPVCGNPNTKQAEIEKQMQQASTALVVKRQLPETARRRFLAEARKSDAELATLRAQETVAEARVREAQAELGVTAELQKKRDELTWRIRFYVDHLNLEQKDPRIEVARLQARIQRMQNQLREAGQRRAAYEAEIGSAINAYAKELGAEFAEACKFVIKDLELRVLHRGREQPLHTVGSGANQVIYHVATVLALHQHFRTYGLPVPNFIMLDQPSQAWFPTTKELKAKDGPATGEASDVQAVNKLYALLARESERLGVQVIAVDHARPDLPAIRAALVEDWRDGSAVPQRPDRLVPANWAQRPTPTT